MRKRGGQTEAHNVPTGADMRQAFDLDAYLGRIGLERIGQTRQGLFDLQAAQIRAIPFENFEPLTGKVPSLLPDDVFAKLVHSRRGGYCFELNQLLEHALNSAGFPVRRSLARVRKGAPQGGPRSHLVLLTEIGGRQYVTDAGFGGPGSLAPLELEPGMEQTAPNGTYRLVEDPQSREIVVEKRMADGWFPLFGFDDAWVGEPDLEAANRMCATWETFPFTGHLTLGAYEGNIRIGLFDRMMTQESAETIERRELEGFTEFEDLVTNRIGIDMHTAGLTEIWARLSAG